MLHKRKGILLNEIAKLHKIIDDKDQVIAGLKEKLIVFEMKSKKRDIGVSSSTTVSVDKQRY
jgi:hypothetical protein